MIIVSACLCGMDTKYDGGNNLNERVVKLIREGKAIPVCPEQLGGLATPRPAHEVCGGTGAEVLDGKAKVLTKEGRDGTKQFLKGAYETLKIAQGCGAKIAILKAKSPSCGHGKVYDGSFSRRKTEGNGVTAELLERNGINIYTEEDNLDHIR